MMSWAAGENGGSRVLMMKGGDEWSCCGALSEYTVPCKANSEHLKPKPKASGAQRAVRQFAPPSHSRCYDLVLFCHVGADHCGARSDHNNDALRAGAKPELRCASCIVCCDVARGSRKHSRWAGGALSPCNTAQNANMCLEMTEPPWNSV